MTIEEIKTELKSLSSESTDSNLQRNTFLKCIELIENFSIWIPISEKLPTENGQYLTFTQTPKYKTMSFCQFIDGEFMSSFITHWADLKEPIN